MGVYAPPHSGLATSRYTLHSDASAIQPTVLSNLQQTTPRPTAHTPFSSPSPLLIKATSTATTPSTRLQRDLLLLTSFNENTTLHWRPTWFPTSPTVPARWTLHNPPNVVTVRLPKAQGGIQHFTRRMRRASDPAPSYIKTWAHWARYCELYSVPATFLCADHVQLLRMGLARDAEGSFCAPPQYPLYPEPPMQGRYALPAETCLTHLPRRFAPVGYNGCAYQAELSEVVVVESSGKLTVEVDGMDEEHQVTSKAYRWSYLPWTPAMEDSCRPLTVKLRLWNAGETNAA